ncbi:HAD-superfamily class IIA hydrolase, TIGR01459 [Filomicrobium insigne]|uniref:HAD-superfamily class IIA hydrolase, TIGR01459 n=2 Tax=Filomicrobium insigne TaxID=418854 RepID=A0A1H0GHW8_9HYPH|nr:HAD-superfamily class IIA hydrolase, TIGR01459 [Filomicrobium insigne]
MALVLRQGETGHAAAGGLFKSYPGRRSHCSSRKGLIPLMQNGTAAERAPVPVLNRAEDLLARYDVLFCDVWGVVHDGFKALPAADDALNKFRRAGGTVILVSNAPVPNHQVAAMLDSRKLSRTAWDAIVSSGDIALTHLRDQSYRQVYTIGPRDRDAALFEAVPARFSSLEDADAILCSGLDDDIHETAESYLPILEQARARDLPFVCANPDLVVDVGGRLYLCAGAIADLYAHLGGDVYWAGKPYISAYGSAHGLAEKLRDASIAKERILGIGDAVRTDLKAAEIFGVDALFIAGGIHREDTMSDGVICRDRLDGLLHGASPNAVAAMPFLAW